MAGALLLVAVAGVLAYLAWPRTSTPVTEDEALDDFRERAGEEGERPAVEGTPLPGVYPYELTGSEQVRLGVLPTQDRSYPATTTVVVVDAGEGCFTATVNLLDQHTEDTTYCTTEGGGLALAEHTKHQQVGALDPEAELSCDPAVLVADGGGDGELACTLSLSGGPASIEADLVGTTEVGEATTVEVDGEDVAALPVTVAYEVSGDLDGTWVERLWFAEHDLLPLRIERELDLAGPATFTERSALVLSSLEPIEG